MNPERVEVLQHKIDRADHIIKYSLVGAAVVVVITLVVIIFQLAALNASVQNSLVESRKNAAENHKRTQDYVKCIAVTLLKPVAERKADTFDQCANGTIDPDTGAFVPSASNVAEQKSSSQIQVGSSPPASVPPAATVPPTPEQPTTSAPPTPEPEQPQPTVIDRLQNGVRSLLDTIKKGI